jgi:hypothetical protein
MSVSPCLAALHTAVLSTGDDVETVAAGLGPALAKRVMSLRNAGGKEAAANQKVQDEVGRRRFTPSKPVLKAPMVSALEGTM